jgi:hypothetical protein
MVGDNARPQISVCIPAYNRPELLPALLDSILGQDFRDFEILVSEDGSPARAEIRAIVERYADRYPGRVRYHENARNLGYDGNLRRLVELARGEYCLFMGNDDLLAPEALAAVAGALKRHPGVGVVLRSYATFEGTPENVIQIFRYFDRELFFPPGPGTIVTFFRRSVVISGLVIHRNTAQRHATDRFDGTLLYQLYLVGSILTHMNGVSLPNILALYRMGGVPDFGNSESEKGRFVPKQQTPESSLSFMRGMLDIARDLEARSGAQVFRGIFRDIGNYSYPVLAIQARQPLGVFLKYCFGLMRMGFWKSGMFYVYTLALLVFGIRGSDRIIGFIKRRLGRTPVLGQIYQGKSV